MSLNTDRTVIVSIALNEATSNNSATAAAAAATTTTTTTTTTTGHVEQLRWLEGRGSHQ